MDCVSKDPTNEEYVYVNDLIFDPVKRSVRIDPSRVKDIIKKEADLPASFKTSDENRKFCVGQYKDNCQFSFNFFEDKNGAKTSDKAKTISILLKEERCK